MQQTKKVACGHSKTQISLGICPGLMPTGQADLSPSWVHMLLCWLGRVVAQMLDYHQISSDQSNLILRGFDKPYT